MTQKVMLEEKFTSILQEQVDRLHDNLLVSCNVRQSVQHWHVQGFPGLFEERKCQHRGGGNWFWMGIPQRLYTISSLQMVRLNQCMNCGILRKEVGKDTKGELNFLKDSEQANDSAIGITRTDGSR